ncbi:UDP-N-acetylglucosamine 1-carboxyvinyltransferase [Candidatus Uhrbacteria bacterium CG10_big_fil_rev_8_21_14_0_10_48_11]|uniref:UDP-N-acetylglucosamine 1-carboxyvinyltransferase n=1 Tax=Candidatus Uhrbacteria bacterium CG10_big_fil_rev_8_21_14_0_10_48_11 TaxID=1975037 RepID=A0A2M8LEF5_9BACT|nr:MAG: UDP-N-acetylglucosamine 1-carboxyvinyltransferase [Candidatus Uhrbacteria bacterium CG10_big_fil_rev_8_21_14_0_10_48_11]
MQPRNTMHEQIYIVGGKELTGTIEVQGAKNAGLKMLAAALLSEEPCTITNLPKIEDIERMKELVVSLGAKITTSPQGTTIVAKQLQTTLEPTITGKLRASAILAGPLLARTGEVFLPYPGGCNLGERPIDIFLSAFRALGVAEEESEKGFRLTAPHGLVGATILLSRVSVTVTETAMMAATLAKGTTTIKNAAMEPEIPALADYLNRCGAKITGAGTSTISIVGVERIAGAEITLIPDRLDTGTFALLGAITNSEITIANAEPNHLEIFWQQLERIGANFTIEGNTIRTHHHNGLIAQNITTHEYPGFPTDLQAPYTVAMTQASGMSLIHETIFSGRLFYTDQLRSMGANIIMCDPYRVIVNGPTKLRGRFLTSPDIRAGIALILAGLVAEGETRIDNIYQIDRGYEDIVGRLKKLGADISRNRPA